MIKAVIFDMDGLLIDTEPLWHKAEIISFKTCGIKLTNEMCFQTMGLRVDEVVNYWYQKLPWKNPSKKEIENLIMKNVISLTKEKGVGKEGFNEALDFVKSKNVKIALASSSYMDLINAVVDKLKIRDYFDVIYSAEFEKYGKPHPGVYITTAEKLGVKTAECIALEDSLNGLLSAKSAKMKCLMVPDPTLKNSPKLAIADYILPSLKDFKSFSPTPQSH